MSTLVGVRDSRMVYLGADSLYKLGSMKMENHYCREDKIIELPDGTYCGYVGLSAARMVMHKYF